MEAKNLEMKIDFTKKRLSKKNHIIKCTECGRTGELHKYKDGSAVINHAGRIINAAGLFTVLEVYGHCYIKNFTEAVK